MKEKKDILKKLGFSCEEVKTLVPKLKYHKVKKNKCHIQYGQKMNCISILYKGAMVSRISGDNGEITTKLYYPKGDNIVVDYAGFTAKGYSTEDMQAVEDCKLLKMSYSDFNELKNESPVFQQLLIRKLEQRNFTTLNKLRDFQKYDNEGLVKKFHNTNKILENIFKVEDIASYLGMDRKTYTRNKKKL